MRVIFRAEFQGPIGPLNGLNLDMSKVKMTVDVFRKGNNWLARNSAGVPLIQIGSHPHPGCAKDAVDAAFTTRLAPWQLCDPDGKPLDPDYVEETPEANFSMRDVTHIMSRKPEHSQPTPKGKAYFIAACGTEVHQSLIRSHRNPHPPLCKECRKEWDKTPKEERFDG